MHVSLLGEPGAGLYVYSTQNDSQFLLAQASSFSTGLYALCLVAPSDLQPVRLPGRVITHSSATVTDAVHMT